MRMLQRSNSIIEGCAEPRQRRRLEMQQQTERLLTQSSVIPGQNPFLRPSSKTFQVSHHVRRHPPRRATNLLDLSRSPPVRTSHRASSLPRYHFSLAGIAIAFHATHSREQGDGVQSARLIRHHSSAFHRLEVHFDDSRNIHECLLHVCEIKVAERSTEREDGSFYRKGPLFSWRSDIDWDCGMNIRRWYALLARAGC